MRFVSWHTWALVAFLSARAAVAAAQSVSITAVAGDDPPVSASAVAQAATAAARDDGFEPADDAFGAAAANLDAGAVPDERLEAFAEARRLADRGWTAYLAVEVDFAASQLVNARRVAARVVDLDGGVELFADVSLRLGVVLSQLGQTDAADDAFRLARALDPTRAVTMAEFAPDVVAAFDAAVAQARERVSVRVTASPAGARIAIDGVDAGAAPVDVELEVGHHVVVARAEGHAPRGELLAVAAGAGDVELVLDPDPTAAAVLAGPAALAVGSAEATAQTAADALVLYGGVDGVVLLASVWRRGAPALLGQWCEDLPAACTRVVEIGYPDEAGLAAAMRTMWQSLQEARASRTFPPTLLTDARLTRGESRPGVDVGGDEPRCSWCRSPWLWVGVGAAALAAGGAYLLTRDRDVAPIITLDPCGFGGCP